jgi:hypothetical protein
MGTSRPQYFARTSTALLLLGGGRFRRSLLWQRAAQTAPPSARAGAAKLWRTSVPVAARTAPTPRQGTWKATPPAPPPPGSPQLQPHRGDVPLCERALLRQHARDLLAAQRGNVQQNVERIGEAHRIQHLGMGGWWCGMRTRAGVGLCVHVRLHACLRTRVWG